MSPEPPPCDELDLLRAWLRGALAPERARELEARMAREPDLAGLAELLRAAHACDPDLAGAAADAVPASRVTFDDLPLDAGHRRPAARRALLVAAVAAAVLLAVGALWLARERGPAADGPASVALAHVRFEGREPALPPEPLLSGWEPLREGRVSWLTDADEAARVARYVEGRVLRFVDYPGCPLCRALEATTLADARLAPHLARLVPLKLDVQRLPEAQTKRVMEAGWPYLAVEDADGAVLATLVGVRSADDLAAALDAALGKAAAARWALARERARREAALVRARRALLAARERAGADPAGARAALVAARDDARDTPAGDDLERVLAAWRPGTPFPTLAEAVR